MSLFSIPDQPTLVFMLGKKSHYRDVIVSKNEIFCSPQEETTKNEEGLYRTIKIPFGESSLDDVLKKLPKEQYPELIVIKMDGSLLNRIRGLAKIQCKKVFIAGGTHIFDASFTSLMDYLAQESFDAIIVDHNRRHVHFFYEAGFKQTYWLPGFNVKIYPHEIPQKIKPQMVFFGQVGRFHPLRTSFLQQMQDRKVPLSLFSGTTEEASLAYSLFSVSLNISLNGDSNLRIYEVLGAGGCLLTDRLSPHEGLDSLFKENRHLIYYESLDELIEKGTYLIHHPEKVLEIRKNVIAEIRPTLLPHVKIQQFYDIINKGLCSYDWKGEGMVRHKRHTPSSHALLMRLKLYEYVQALQRNQVKVSLGFSSCVDDVIRSDFQDLHRVVQYSLGGCHEELLPVFLDIMICQEGDIRDVLSQMMRGEVVFRQMWIIDRGQQLSFEESITSHLHIERHGFLQERNQHLFSLKSMQHLIEYYFKRKKWTHIERVLREFQKELTNLKGDCLCAFEMSRQLGLKELQEYFLEACLSFNRIEPYFLQEKAYLLYGKGFLDQGFIYELEACRYRKEGVHYEGSRYVSLFKTLSPQAQHCISDYLDKVGSSLPFYAEFIPYLPKHKEKRQSPLNILVITNFYPPQELGGYGRKIENYVKGLLDKGHKVRIVSSNYPHLNFKQEKESDGVNRGLELIANWVNGCPSNVDVGFPVEEVSYRNLDVLKKELDESFPDVIFVGNIDFLHGDFIFKHLLALNIPIFHHLGCVSYCFVDKTISQHPCYHSCFDTQWLKDNFESRGFDVTRGSVVFPAIHTDAFYIHHPCSFDKLRLCFVGLLTGAKGINLMCQLLVLLHNKKIPFSCEIAGATLDPFLNERLDSYLKEHGIRSHVTVLGFQTQQELRSLYARSNVLLFPSICHEGFGMVQVEGMSSGLALVSSGVGGAREVFHDGEEGFLFNCEEVDDFARVLVSLIENPEKTSQVAFSGQTRAFKMYSFSQSINLIEKELCMIVNKTSSRRKVVK